MLGLSFICLVQKFQFDVKKYPAFANKLTLKIIHWFNREKLLGMFFIHLVFLCL